MFVQIQHGFLPEIQIACSKDQSLENLRGVNNEKVCSCAMLVDMCKVAFTLGIWSWKRAVAEEDWENSKNLREDAVGLQEEALNQRDLAVVLEQTYVMLRSTRKKLIHLYLH